MGNEPKKKIVPIPENYLEILTDEDKIRVGLSDKMINASSRVIQFESQLDREKKNRNDIFHKLVDSNKKIKKVVDKLFKKLKLDQQVKEYDWSFEGDKFVGTPRKKNPNSPITKEK